MNWKVNAKKTVGTHDSAFTVEKSFEGRMFIPPGRVPDDHFLMNVTIVSMLNNVIAETAITLTIFSLAIFFANVRGSIMRATIGIRNFGEIRKAPSGVDEKMM